MGWYQPPGCLSWAGSPYAALFFVSLFSPPDLPLSCEPTVLSLSLALFLLHHRVSLLPDQLEEALMEIQVLLSLLQSGPEQCVTSDQLGLHGSVSAGSLLSLERTLGAAWLLQLL